MAGLEGVEHPFDVGLLPAVGGGGDGVGRPGLVDRPVGRRGVGAHRGRVDDRPHAGGGRGCEHPCAAHGVHLPGQQRVVAGLEEPGEVDDGVRARQHRLQRVRGDVGGHEPDRRRPVDRRLPPRDRDDLGHLGTAGQLVDHARPHVAGRADHHDAHGPLLPRRRGGKPPLPRVSRPVRPARRPRPRRGSRGWPGCCRGRTGRCGRRTPRRLLAHGPGRHPAARSSSRSGRRRRRWLGHAVLDGAVAVRRQVRTPAAPPSASRLALDGGTPSTFSSARRRRPTRLDVDRLDREQHTAPVRHGPRVEDVGGDDVDRSADQGGRMVGHHGARRYTLAGRAHRVSGHPPAPGATGAGGGTPGRSGRALLHDVDPAGRAQAMTWASPTWPPRSGSRRPRPAGGGRSPRR